jgi:tRNA(adenine34) deaminase
VRAVPPQNTATIDGVNDSDFMDIALAEARTAGEHGDVPIGAVVVRGGEVVAKGRNAREALRDPTAHAEILALRVAAVSSGEWRLDGCTLYVTLEPCAMCAGAVVLARIQRLVYGAVDPKAGAVRSLYNIADDRRLNHRVEVVEGVREQECSALLADFFASKR